MIQVHTWTNGVNLQDQCTAVFLYALCDNCSVPNAKILSFLLLSPSIPLPLSLSPLYSTGLVSYNNALFLYRFFYPFILLSLLTTILVLIIIKQCKRLYRHVRNEKQVVTCVIIITVLLKIHPCMQVSDWSSVGELRDPSSPYFSARGGGYHDNTRPRNRRTMKKTACYV